MPSDDTPTIRRVPVIAIAAAVCIAIGCDGDRARVRKSPADTLKTAAAHMKLTFPENTRVLGYDSSIGERSLLPTPDHYIQLKVEFDRADLDAFLKGSPFANETLDTEQRKVSGTSDATWWNPDAPVRFRSGIVELPSVEFLNILIDLDRKDKVVVYLMWHET